MPKIPKLTTPRKSQRTGDLTGAPTRTPHHATPKKKNLKIHCTVPHCSDTFRLESDLENHMSVTHSGRWAPENLPEQCNVRPCPAVFWSDAERIAHTKIAHEWYECPLSWHGTERICWRQFLNVGDMHKHMWKVHGDEEFMFECGRCRKDYVSRLGSVCQACEEDG